MLSGFEAEKAVVSVGNFHGKCYSGQLYSKKEFLQEFPSGLCFFLKLSLMRLKKYFTVEY